MVAGHQVCWCLPRVSLDIQLHSQLTHLESTFARIYVYRWARAYTPIHVCLRVCVCLCVCVCVCAFVNFGIAIDGLLSLLKMYAIKIVCALICEKRSCIFPRYAALSVSSLHSGTKLFFFTIQFTCLHTWNSGWWITNNKVEFVFY